MFDATNDDWNSAQGDPAAPSYYVMELGFVDLAMAMIKEGEQSVNYFSSSHTALGVACSKGFEDLVHDFLAHGAKVGIRDAHGRTAVYYAASNGQLERVKLLIDNGADIEV